jgi:hypothetical protein
MVMQLHPTAPAGDRFQSANQRPTIVDGLRSVHTGYYMLCFACPSTESEPEFGSKTV